ncbi:aminotransferase class IV [Bifidobacterium callimiconis]|uniref:4-amino-4-deoxychorismate lyase n=1 Tax=Bifidobacterium callimiconis TaxID=2306973 RepID=A0A430FIE8_9BIFI|nr:aminotransferase class IV [Bifidobacterium callimiconis]MBT1176289.1 aminotransferase class IV [Bifidobacterium callimiconis]RSX52587.1 4-amino-4-deoxychorismate lyase [Bifidobacterium callimiconis]
MTESNADEQHVTEPTEETTATSDVENANGENAESHENENKPAVRTIALDEGYQFGLGVFETMALRAGRIMMLDRHLARLRKGAEALGITAPSDDDLRWLIGEHLHEAGLEGSPSAVVKVIVSESNTVITDRDNPYDDWKPGRALRLGWCESRRNERSVLTYHKTLNQGDNMLEFRKAHELGFDGAVFLNSRGEVCEATNANLFFVRDGRWYTPAVECGLLPGTVRQRVCEMHRAVETHIRPDDLAGFDACYATNSLMGVRPVAELGEARFAVEGSNRI